MSALDRAFFSVFSFRGEIGRKTFSYFFFGCFLILMAANAAGFAIDEMIVYQGLPEGWILLPLIGMLGALVAYMSAVTRRVRDAGFGMVFTAMCIFASIALPVAGLLVAVFLMAQPHSDAEGTFADKLKPTLVIVVCVGLAYALFAWGGIFFTISGCEPMPFDLVIGDTCFFGSLILSMGATAVMFVIGLPLALLAFILRSMRT